MILAGALGGTVHALRSLYWYIGNRDLKLSWVPMYILLPLNGAMISVAFHLIILGGFVTDLKNTNTWLGLIAIAAMVGLFSEQASLKLKDIANAIFTKPGEGKDSKPQPSGATADASAQAPKLAGIEPKQGPISGRQNVTLSGTGFAKGIKVSFGGNPAEDIKVVSNSSITVKTPSSKQSGKVAVEVINPDGKSDKLADGYTYTEG